MDKSTKLNVCPFAQEQHSAYASESKCVFTPCSCTGFMNNYEFCLHVYDKYNEDKCPGHIALYYYLDTHYKHVVGNLFDALKVAETSDIDKNTSSNHSKNQDINYSNSLNRKNIKYVIENNFAASNVSNLISNIIDVDNSNSDSSVQFVKTTDKKKSKSIISKHSKELSLNTKRFKKNKNRMILPKRKNNIKTNLKTNVLQINTNKTKKNIKSNVLKINTAKTKKKILEELN